MTIKAFSPSRFMQRAIYLLALLCLALGPFCAAQASTPLPNDAYIWQRSWTPEVTQALRASQDLVRGWRVLAAEYGKTHEGYRWIRALPDWQTLAAVHEPVIAVFRIDGQITQWKDADLIAGLTPILQSWREHGVSLAGVEIDYDCGTARLPRYVQFLRALRPALGDATRLSITALPTWLDSADLDALLAVSDEAVLQLHAVMNPLQGLFDADQAYAWTQAFAQRTQRPWRVALPNYGTRVTWGKDGRIVAIESERPALYPGGLARELIAAPEVIRAFVMRIDREPPRGLAGIVWFRLPTSTDARAWSSSTWHAVLARDKLSGRIDVIAKPAESAQPAGLYDVWLLNRGNTDTPLPKAVRVSSNCLAADGINGYTLARDGQNIVLRRDRQGLLRAGAQRNIGWLRCEGTGQTSGITLHVDLVDP